MPRLAFVPFALVAALAIASPAGAADEAREAREGREGHDRIALGEVSVTEPAPAPGLDRAALQTAAEREIRGIDARGVKRRVIVSVALVRASDEPVACTVSALIRDGKSGNVIAIVEGRASSGGGGTVARRTAVLGAAVRTAVHQIPTALSGS